MAKKKDIFSTINGLARTGRTIVRTGKKIEKALSPDYEYNFLTGRFTKKKKPPAEKQPPTKPAKPTKVATSANKLQTSPLEVLSEEWLDEHTFVQHGNGFETTITLNKIAMTADVVLVSECGCFTDLQAFKDFFMVFVDGVLGSMPKDYMVSAISANAVFDKFSKDMWKATWTPNTEVTYERR